MNNFETIKYQEETNSILIIDQSKLPNERIIKELLTIDDVMHAIRMLEVRGAPAIGVIAAYGLAMFSAHLKTKDWLYFVNQIKTTGEYLKTARPTALNLSVSIDNMLKVLTINHDKNIEILKSLLLEEAQKQKKINEEACYLIGQYGVELIKNEDIIITYCNAGYLATASHYGTALAPIYVANERGLQVNVVVCETRPVLQGARLTSYELTERNISTTVICDNMVASYMNENRVSAVIVGADCIAANGDVANKIGTLGLAILADAFNVPFYVCAPSTTINYELSSGKDIIIEFRDEHELRNLWYKNEMISKRADIWNPAFDITPNRLISGIITEDGIFRSPYNFGA